MRDAAFPEGSVPSAVILHRYRTRFHHLNRDKNLRIHFRVLDVRNFSGKVRLWYSIFIAISDHRIHKYG